MSKKAVHHMDSGTDWDLVVVDCIQGTHLDYIYISINEHSCWELFTGISLPKKHKTRLKV